MKKFFVTLGVLGSLVISVMPAMAATKPLTAAEKKIVVRLRTVQRRQSVTRFYLKKNVALTKARVAVVKKQRARVKKQRAAVKKPAVTPIKK